MGHLFSSTFQQHFLITLGICLGLSGTIRAQEACVAASGETQNSAGNITWSVGQTAFMDCQSTTGSQIQGVQQPYELQFFPGINDPEGIVNPLFVLYPNPASEVCWLKVKEVKTSGLRFEVHDLKGNRLMDLEIPDHDKPVSLGNLTPGVYVVTLWKETTCMQQRKLIKR